ncbi:MAG: hypothetical protein GY731_11960, partial [Gammaproteobacteria bacterium]|nr:hypothetical protein [Gammaproteobacteria bacterium]
MAGKIIGEAIYVKGGVEIRSADGVIRILKTGDSVHAGDLLITAIGGQVSIAFQSGRVLEVTEMAEVLLDETVYRLQEFDVSQVITNVDTLSLAIENNLTDLADLDPTAAGPTDVTVSGDSSLSSLGNAPLYERGGLEGNVDVQPTPIDGQGPQGGRIPSEVPLSVVDDITVSTKTSSVNLSLSATDPIMEGSPITYTATLDNPAGSAMTVTLSNGAIINITVGSTSGTVVINASDDVYLGGDAASVTIASSSGGNFESLAIDTDPAVTTITDDADVTNLTLTATDPAVEGG